MKITIKSNKNELCFYGFSVWWLNVCFAFESYFFQGEKGRKENVSNYIKMWEMAVIIKR